MLGRTDSVTSKPTTVGARSWPNLHPLLYRLTQRPEVQCPDVQGDTYKQDELTLTLTLTLALPLTLTLTLTPTLTKVARTRRH